MEIRVGARWYLHTHIVLGGLYVTLDFLVSRKNGYADKNDPAGSLRSLLLLLFGSTPTNVRFARKISKPSTTGSDMKSHYIYLSKDGYMHQTVPVL